MLRVFLVLVAGWTLLGCSMEMPGFLGRTGSGSDTYRLGGVDLPDPQPVALRTAMAEPALRGVILRAEGVAPTQGFHSATLAALGGSRPDASGIVTFELVAVPPEELQPVGPENTRRLSAALFVPTRGSKDMRGFRISGAGRVQTLAMPRPAEQP